MLTDKWGQPIKVGDKATFYGEPGKVISLNKDQETFTWVSHLGEQLDEVLPEDLLKTLI